MRKLKNPAQEKSNISLNNQIQNNFFIDTEINAISKLSPELADRAMSILENSLKHKIDIDNKIIQGEDYEQKARILNMKLIHWYNFIGQFIAFLLTFAGVAGTTTLLILNKEWYISLSPLLAPLSIIITAFLNRK